MKDAKKYLEEILENVKQMVLCTCKNNKPWSATVFFVFDKNLNLYLFSRPARRHSKEIIENPSVSGAIAKEHKDGLGEPSRGVQFEGRCKLVEKSELKDAYNIYKKRFPQIIKFHPLENASKELYKIEVNNFVLFDTLIFPNVSRQELKWQS